MRCALDNQSLGAGADEMTISGKSAKSVYVQCLNRTNQNWDPSCTKKL